MKKKKKNPVVDCVSLKREGSVVLAIRFLGFGSHSLLKAACLVHIRSAGLQHFQALKYDVDCFCELLVLLDHLTGLNLLSWWGTVQTKCARWESVVSYLYAGWRNLRALMVCHLEKAPTPWPSELVQVRNQPRSTELCPDVSQEYLLSCLLDMSHCSHGH